MQPPINIELGYKKSYMDKNLFMLGLIQLIDNGFKFLMDEFKKALEAKDCWKLRNTSRSLKEIADYHGATALSEYCATIKQHADKGEIDHTYPIYALMAKEVFFVRRSLIKYLKENKGSSFYFWLLSAILNGKNILDSQYKETTKEDEIPLVSGFKAVFKPYEVEVIDVNKRAAPVPSATIDIQKKIANCCTIF